MIKLLLTPSVLQARYLSLCVGQLLSFKRERHAKTFRFSECFIRRRCELINLNTCVCELLHQTQLLRPSLIQTTQTPIQLQIDHRFPFVFCIQVKVAASAALLRPSPVGAARDVA